MNKEDLRRCGAELERPELILAQENHNAALTMWIGLGSILSLLTFCFLSTLWHGVNKLYLTGALMVLLLLISVLLFFLGGKKDERWYLVCSLLNHAGIGLAVPILMETLDLSVRPVNLAVSGLPGAAILFGAAMFYISGEGENRKKLLYWSAAILGLIFAGSLIKFYGQRTEFWLCMAICALMSCLNLAALIWVNRDAEQRSANKGLAVVSFSVYLILLIAAAVALYIAAFSSGGGSDRNKTRSKSGKTGGNGQSISGRESNRSGSRSFLGDLIGNRRTGRVFRTRSYFPFYLWYYTPYNRCAVIDRMTGVCDAEKEKMRRDYRRKRLVTLIIVACAVIAVFAAAVILGRG